MRRLVLAFALGIAVILMVLPSAASAWGRFGTGAVVVASSRTVVVVPRVSVAVVSPFPRAVIVVPQRAVIVAASVPFFAWPPVVYAAPAYAAPATYYAAPPPPAIQREVVYAHGRYVLYGDGVTVAYQWVWVPNPPPPPPPAAGPPPAQ